MEEKPEWIEGFEEAKSAFKKKAEEIFSGAEEFEDDEKYRRARREDNIGSKQFNEKELPDDLKKLGFVGYIENEGKENSWFEYKMLIDPQIFSSEKIFDALGKISGNVTKKRKKILKYHLYFNDKDEYIIITVVAK